MIERIIRSASLALLNIAAAGVLLLSVMIFGGVLWRYVLGSPLNFILPLGEYVLLAVVFLAMAGTLLNEGHVRIDFVTDMMPRKVRVIVGQIGDAIGIATITLIAWLSITQFTKLLRTGETDISLLRIPMYATQWLLVLGFGLTAIVYVLKWIRKWSELSAEPISESDNSTERAE